MDVEVVVSEGRSVALDSFDLLLILAMAMEFSGPPGSGCGRVVVALRDEVESRRVSLERLSPLAYKGLMRALFEGYTEARTHWRRPEALVNWESLLRVACSDPRY